MSRTGRQSQILNLIAEKEIETQDELVSMLKAADFDVTQATVSRDIKELGLVKAMCANGKYKYVTPYSLDNRISDKLLSVMRETVVSVVTAENLVIIKTIADTAATVKSALDKLCMQEVLGILADKDVVLVVCKNAQIAEFTAEKVNNIL